MMEQATFWDRLEARKKPSGALVTIENPRTIVWMALSWTDGAALNSLHVGASGHDVTYLGWGTTLR